jgi:hypothetical protein
MRRIALIAVAAVVVASSGCVECVGLCLLPCAPFLGTPKGGSSFGGCAAAPTITAPRLDSRPRADAPAPQPDDARRQRY